MANPTLLETKYVKANCIVKSIEVEGGVYVQSTLNGHRVDDMLSDVIYKHESETKCASFKTFNSISAPNIELTSKLVNGMLLDDFVTTDSDQTFHVNKLRGNIFFSNLKLGGLFNFINVTELDENTIKLSGEQFTEAELIFEGENGGIAIDANALDILATINDLPVDKFIGIDENFELNEDVTLNEFVANECVVGGMVNGGAGNAKINGWDVNALQKSYLSKSREQQMLEPFHVRTVILRGTFDANYVNNFDFQDALNILQSRKSNEELMNGKSVRVARAAINGSVHFDRANGFDLEMIKANAIWLNRPNDVRVPLTFSSQMRILGNLTTTLLNNVDFTEFANDLVYKSNEKPYIRGTTIFRQDLVVTHDIDAAQVNGYNVAGILRKGNNLPISNSINIYGDVIVSDLTVNGSLGSIRGSHIWDNYRYDETNQEHVLTKNVQFSDGAHIAYLQLGGGINDVYNASYHLETLVRKDRTSQINGIKTFVDAVYFDNDIQIQRYDGNDVDSFLNNVILIDQEEPIDVHSLVVFNDAVTFTRLNVNGALKVNTIADCSLSEWYANAIRTDLPYKFDRTVTFGADAIEVGNIEVTSLNDHLVQHIVTLNTEQRFSEPVSLDDVIASVPINASRVVDIDLAAERDNTLMVSRNRLLDAHPNLNTIFHTRTDLRQTIRDAEYELSVDESVIRDENHRHRE